MTITKSMNIIQVVQKHPETMEVFMRFGMGCVGCAAAQFENIEQGASVHGIDVDELITELNKIVEEE